MDAQKVRDVKDKFFKKLATGKEQMKTVFANAARRASPTAELQEEENSAASYYEIPHHTPQVSEYGINSADTLEDEGIYEDFAERQESVYSCAEDDTYDYPEAQSSSPGKKRFGLQRIKKQLNNLKLPESGLKIKSSRSESPVHARGHQKLKPSNLSHGKASSHLTLSDTAGCSSRSSESLPATWRNTEKPQTGKSDNFVLQLHRSDSNASRSSYGDVSNILYTSLQTNSPVRSEGSSAEAEERANPLYGSLSSSPEKYQTTQRNGSHMRQVASAPTSPNLKYRSISPSFSPLRRQALEKDKTGESKYAYSENTALNPHIHHQNVNLDYLCADARDSGLKVQSGDNYSYALPLEPQLSGESGFVDEPIFGTINKDTTSFASSADILSENYSLVDDGNFDESDVYEYH